MSQDSDDECDKRDTPSPQPIVIQLPPPEEKPPQAQQPQAEKKETKTKAKKAAKVRFWSNSQTFSIEAEFVC